MAEKNASAAQTAQKFPIERLAKACLLSTSDAAAERATAGKAAPRFSVTIIHL